MSPVWKQIGIVLSDLPEPQFGKQSGLTPFETFVLVKCPLRQPSIEIREQQLETGFMESAIIVDPSSDLR